MGATQTLTSTEIELYLSRGCLAPPSYAQTAHDQSLLFTFSYPNIFHRDRVLQDAHSAPLLYSKNRVFGLKRRAEIYRGESDANSSLVFTLEPATFSSSLKIIRHEDVVVRVERGLVFCGCFGPSYIILVSPGMDLAMAVLLVAIFDDFRPRDKSSK
ncbi:hypothetical protein GOP47_0021957 [Adiantum capillus-veneris]|uniref:Uncharacterized protein n=1 Tax=Adiantum capillus-veneris TaxID=13818 RepID=A0A9D4U8P4_ADICA|nr:hypothetical protein GOP47_0021957 [Adiantum capillus-veneris]